ncbi:MAG: TonB-dependent receptor plug domain-containing protein [Bacteroidia bacterium]|nr:TonB-dependent receptor plug domain-containing protein [Bacteroidia bacterium]
MLKRFAECILLLVLYGVNTLTANMRINAAPQDPVSLINPPDSIKTLPAVIVPAIRYTSFLTGSKLEFINQQLLDQNNQNSLAQLLSDHSQLFVKSYGPSNLASPGFRGSNANHTPVLWNGFNLQSAMNGQVDLSLFPAFLSEGIAIQYGSPAALFGSGAMGGAIHLQSISPQQNGLKGEILTGMSSYQSYSNGIKLFYRTDKWQLSQKIFTQQAGNQFAYKNISLLQNSNSTDFIKINEAPTEHAVNAGFQTLAWMQEYTFNPTLKHTFILRSWIQKNERGLPPALNLNDLQAHQTDKVIRINGEYKYIKAAYELNFRHGFFDDYLRYSDKNIGEAISRSQSNITYLDQFYKFSCGQIQVSLMNQYNVATNASYNGLAQQHRFAIFASFKIFRLNQKFQQQLSLRQEWVDGNPIPVMPSYGFQLDLNRCLAISGNVSRSYRLPTFNDLYWAVSGNPTLLPEAGWNEELSIKYKTVIAKTIRVYTTFTGYNKNIHNWIIWVPDQNGNARPQNITQVWSRGLEADWKISNLAGKWTLFASGLHDLTIATNQEEKSVSDSSLYKQLIYTPRIKHILSAGINYKGYTLTYSHHYTGVRFVSTDNKSWLLPYQTAKISLSKSIQVKKTNLLIQAQVNNLFNETYQAIVNRPMPLRNYQLSINFKF